MRNVSLLFILALFLMTASAGCSSKKSQTTDFLAKAKHYIAHKRYRSALLELKSAVQQNPKNDAALLELGKVYMLLGEVPMAVKAYDSAVKANPNNVEAHLKMGQILLVAQDTLAAHQAANIILKKSPNNIGGLLLLAAVQVQEKNPAGAIKTLRGAITAHPQVIRARLFLAHLLEGQGERDAAEKTYLEAISVDRSAPGPYIKLMRLYAVNGRWDQARGILHQLLSQSQKDDPELIPLGRLFESEKHFHMAEKLYQHAVSTAPSGNASAMMHLGNYYARRDEPKEAMGTLQKALKIDPKDTDVLTSIARLHLGMGDIKAADIAIQKALNIDPEHLPSIYVNGLIDFQKKDYVAASGQFNYLIKNRPNDAMPYYYKALCMLNNKSPASSNTDLVMAAAGYSGDASAWIQKQVKTNLRQAIKLAPRFLPARLLLAEIYLRARDANKAAEQINEILAKAPDQESALVLQASLKVLQRDFRGAEAACKKALEKAPHNSQWLARLGLVYTVMNRPAQAVAVCREALDRNPRQLNALQLLIAYQVKAKKFDEALSLCEKEKGKLNDTPNNLAAVENMEGGIFLAQNNPKRARQHFEQALSEAPDFIAPRMALANMDLLEKQTDAAISELKGALAVNAQYLPACMSLGDIYYREGNKKEAENYYRKALKIDGNYAKAANNLAYILAGNDQTLQEALGLAQIAAGRMPNDPTALDTLGWIQYRMGNYYQSISNLKQCLAIAPDYAVANYHLGLAYYGNKEFDKARAHLKKALKLDPNFDGADNARSLLD